MLTPFSVNISVADLDAALAWYGRVLGFETVYRHRYADKHLEIAFLRQGDFRIEVIQFDSGAPGAVFADPPRHGATRGITHFALTVPDLAQSMAGLSAQGVPIAGGPTHFEELKMKVVFIRDPDGNLVKLVEVLP